MEHASARRPAIGPRPDTTPRAPHLLRVARPARSGYTPLKRLVPPTPPASTRARTAQHITSIEKKRRHRGEAAKGHTPTGDEGDVTLDLLLKRLNEMFTTYV